MATGTLPFRGESAALIFKAIFDAVPVPPTSLNPNLPAELERIIHKALEKDRRLRYQSAAEIRTDLQRVKRYAESRPPVLATAKVEPPTTQELIGSRWMAATGAATLIVMLAAGGWLFFSRKAHALTDKDTIVLADFDNKTGDPVFDDALRQALAVQLGQSPFLSIVSDRRIEGTLQLMGRPQAQHITRDLAQEICIRTGSKAIVLGSIANFGGLYVIGLNAIGCGNDWKTASQPLQARESADGFPVLSERSVTLTLQMRHSGHCGTRL